MYISHPPNVARGDGQSGDGQNSPRTVDTAPSYHVSSYRRLKP